MASEAFWLETEDWHTAGEPFRIVPRLPEGSFSTSCSVAERRLEILSSPAHSLDLLRRSLCHEPRGHSDMYGGFIVPPDDDGAHFGVLFWHCDGFATACGHGTIALGYWAIAQGLVAAPRDGSVDVVMDVPSGRVTAKAAMENGKVKHVDFVNVASYQIAKQQSVIVSIGQKQMHCPLDLAFGGAVYACVDVQDLGLRVDPKSYRTFIDIQRQIKSQLLDFSWLGKYDLYAVIFFQHLDDSEDVITQENVVVFADGHVDRSPCGSGTAARVAVLKEQGRMSGNKKLLHHSILNTVFEAGVVSSAASETDCVGCIPYVRGSAHLVGRMNFFIDPTDPVYPGFIFR